VLEKAVREILSANPNINTVKLIGTVYAKFFNVNSGETFNEVLRKIADRRLPSFESVTRTKRTVLNEIKKKK